MVIIGLILIALGALAILCAFAFTDPGTGGTYLGVDVNVLSAFLIGVAAGAAIFTGTSRYLSVVADHPSCVLISGVGLWHVDWSVWGESEPGDASDRHATDRFELHGGPGCFSGCPTGSVEPDGTGRGGAANCAVARLADRVDGRA